MKIVLASRSAARARILHDAGVEVEVRSAGVDEAPLKAAALARGESPRQVAETLAAAKAIAGSRETADWTIGADQTLEFEGRLFDKADSLDQARGFMRKLRGKSHQLHAAVALAREGRMLWRDTQSVSLSMRPFSDAFLESYLQRNADIVVSCVGGYAFEGEGVQLFEAVEGDYFAVLGLPILPLLAELRRHALVPE